MKKFLSVLIALILAFSAVTPCIYAAESFTVSQVEEMLIGIDTLSQMQSKRNSYTASGGHYDINTTNKTTISRHTTARTGYESYVSDMFAKREAAQKAYDSLSDSEKAMLDSSLVSKLDNELQTSFKSGEYALTTRNDEYSFEAVSLGAGFGYEVSNHMISGEIPQTFIVVDTSDGATTWTPNGKYVPGESNYDVAYCCDVETPIAYGTFYKRINLEDSSYFNEDEAQHIRAVLENSYPFITMDEMKVQLKKGGLDSAFVDSLTRADMIAAVQMAVWSYANINDGAADGLQYFASIDVPKNTGIYFTPLHDYTNEIWDWLPGKRQRTFDPRAEYRVNTLGNYLCNLNGQAASFDQTVISEARIVRTELVSFHEGVYDVTVYVTLNGGGDSRDNLEISAVSYSKKTDGSISVTDIKTEKATLDEDCYSIELSVKDGDLVRIEINGQQYLSKGVYFYDPEGGRESSQSLVGISEGYTNVKADREVIFSAPEYTIVAPDEVEITIGENTVLKTEVIPEIGAPAVLYTSSDESVVRVDEKGNIETVGVGTATITAYLEGNEENRVTITVTVELPRYIIETPEQIKLTAGTTEPIHIKITPDDGRLSPIFHTDDESIATVDENGNITGISDGSTTVYIDFGNGEIRAIPVTVVAPVVTPTPVIPKKHYVCFGKTDGIGWYEVSVNGGDFFPQGPNSTLEVEEGSVLVVRVQDMFIDDEFDFYVNGSKVPTDVANTITVVVNGYMLIGALSMDVDVPDVEESLNIFQKIIKAIKDFFAWIESLFNL